VPRSQYGCRQHSTRKPNLPDDPVVPAIERKIVEHYVSCRDPEGGLDADQTVDHVLTNEIYFGVAFRLRVGEQHDVKVPRLVCPDEPKIDRSRQWSRRRQAG